MRLLVTRPAEDAAPLAEALRARGHRPMIEPLLTVVWLDDAVVDLDGVAGLLVTSANGVRAFARRSDRRELPVWAVGDASARAARDAGFTTVESAAGDVASLAALLRDRVAPPAGVLLHPAGTRVAGDLAGLLDASGHRYRRAVLYEARTADALSPAAVAALRTGGLDGVLLFSPRTAATFVRLAREGGVAGECAGLDAFCLSRAVADAAAVIAWRRFRIAARPDEAALLETLDIGAPLPA